MIVKNAIRSLAVAACVFALSACGDDKPRQADAPKVSNDQAEVQKYNAYVGVANSVNSSYGEELEKYQKYIQPTFEGKEPMKDLSYYSSFNMDRTREQLDKAVAMKPEMAELDGPARKYSEALAKAAPLYNDMTQYISAKTYTSDKGAHGREIQPAFIESMTALAQAQEGYFDGIEAKDRARTKAEFENAKKDTQAYFRAGMVYYSKDAMDHAEGVFDGSGLGDRKDAFKQSVDQFNTMATSYDAKVRESNQKGCPSFMMTANAFTATSRSIIERTEDGSYVKEAKEHKPYMPQTQAVRDAYSLRQHFNNLVSALNTNRC
ncbi:YiiG family protein [Bordetella genomosp. 13]|uniref:YiiG family protein n=1 Tax=Bordetella genomosp. 13 TaxID=463040 RepID=UPI0011A52136|nr:YiiG family protein [Bordetella genomosp. 13]